MSNNKFDQLVLFSIYSFLELRDVLSNCFLVCREWNLSLMSSCSQVDNKLTLPIVKLDLSNRKIYDDKLIQIIDNNLNRYNWSELKDLNVGRNIIGKPGFSKLFDEENGISGCKVTNFRTLILNDNQIDTGIEYFSKIKEWINLRELNLSRNFITKVDFSHTQFINLHSLDLSYNLIGNRGVQSLLQNSHFPNLTSLKLVGIGIFDKGTNPLVTYSHNIPKLKLLDLSSNHLHTTGLEIVAQMTCPLETLLCYNSRIGDGGVKCLSSSTCLLTETLTTIDLSSNLIDDEELEWMTYRTFPKLKTLLLNDNHLGNNGMYCISDLKTPNLTCLNIAQNAVGLEGVRILEKSTNLPQLESLDCSNSSCSRSVHKNYESAKLNNFLEDCEEIMEEEPEWYEEDFDGNMRNARGEEIDTPALIVSFSWNRNLYYSSVY